MKPDGANADERLRDAQARLAALAALPFDLERGPLLRLTVFELDTDDHLALLVIHHIAADAWSFGVLLRELAAFYGASALGGEPALPELAIQYADFSAWQRRRVEGQADEHLDFWRQALTGAPTAEFPSDKTRPAVKTSRGGASPLAIEAGRRR